LAHTTVDFLTRFLTELPAAPSSDFDAVEAVLADPALRRPPAEQGRPLTELLDVIGRAAGRAGRSGGRRAEPLHRAGLSGAWARRVEADLLRWLADLFALPAAAAGTLTSGGSLATFSALVAARNDRLPENQVHHAVAKAARLAGFPSAAVHTVATDSTLRMDMTTLTEAVAADRAGNLQPFCVVASAGTTNTGAIDPLPEIAEFCAREGLWLHVDGAYGAAFVLTDRGRQRLRGIDRADSLYSTHTRASSCPRHRLPTGPRRRRAAGGALRRGCPLPAGHRGARPAGFRRHQPRTHPRLPGLRLWLPLHLHGVAAFRAALDEKLDLTGHAYRVLRAEPTLNVLGPPQLTTVAFRRVLTGADDAAEDAATADLLRRVNAERRVFLSSTRIAGRYVGRISVLNHRTDRARVDEALDAIRRHTAPG